MANGLYQKSNPLGVFVPILMLVSKNERLLLLSAPLVHKHTFNTITINQKWAQKENHLYAHISVLHKPELENLFISSLDKYQECRKFILL